jgi:hypothetical protein
MRLAWAVWRCSNQRESLKDLLSLDNDCGYTG